MTWTAEFFGKKQIFSKPVLIEGLPGIGSVGKIVVDFLVENSRAKKIARFKSNQYPHAVFVNEQNLVQLPSIDLFHKKIGANDILFLAGDVQPVTEQSCYDFSDVVLDLFQSVGGDSLVTLGGVALRYVPKNPRIFITGTDKTMIAYYVKGADVIENLYGIVGPIIGVSGVLLGLSGRRKIPSIALLAETYGHPLYTGVAGARAILGVLNKKLDLGIPASDMDKSIIKLEAELIRSKNFVALQRRALTPSNKKDTTYIG